MPKYPSRYVDADWQQSPDIAADARIMNQMFDAVHPLDLPAIERSEDPYIDKQGAELRMQMQEVVARRPDVYAQAVQALETKNTGIVGEALEFATGLEATESGLQTFIDVLSLPNYAMAALADARVAAMDAERQETGEVSWLTRFNPLGFSGSDWKRAFQDRTYFGDVYGVEYDFGTAAGWGSIATDIALDPLTYLTFGVGAGAKVLAKTGSKNIARALGRESLEGGAELTLSRWGSAVQKEAARELWPKVSDDIARQANEGGEKLAHIAEREGFLEKSIDYMLDPANYNRLAAKAWEKDKRFSTKAQKLLGESVSEADELARPNVNRVFQETTPLAQREIGISGRALRRRLESLDANKFFGKITYNTMKRFNPTWGLDENSRELLSTMRNSINDQKRTWGRTIIDEFSDLSDDDAFAVVNVLENTGDFVNFTAANAAPHLVAKYSPRVMEAAERAKQIFADIAAEEQKVGVLNETLDDYVAHIFNYDTRKIDQFHQVKKEKGWSTTANPFSNHRQIASLSELKGLFPEDQLVTNIGEILYRRKMMSIDVVNKQKFYTEMAAKSGAPAELIAKAGENIPAAYRKRMMETRSSAAELADLRQYYHHEGFNAASWGFKEGSTDNNLAILRWLATDRTARAADAPWVTDRLSNFTQKIKTKFSYKYNKAPIEVDAIDAINGLLRNDPLDKMPFDMMEKAIRGLDAELRKKGVGPLLGIMPELESKLASALRTPNKPPKYFKKFIDDLSKPVKDLKLEAAIPEEMAIRAVEFRRQMGVLTDDLSPSSQALSSIGKLLNNFGFKPAETKQLLKTMYGKESLERITKAEADGLEVFLGLQAGKKSAVQRYSNMIGEELVQVHFRTPKGEIPTIFTTNVNDIIEAGKKSVQQTSSMIQKVTEKTAKASATANTLRTAKNALAQYNNTLAKELSVRRGLKKSSQEWKNSMEKTRQTREFIKDITSQHGNAKAIDKRVAALQKNIDRLSKQERSLRAVNRFNKSKDKFLSALDKDTRSSTKATVKALNKATEDLKVAYKRANPKASKSEIDNIAEKITKDTGFKKLPPKRDKFIPRDAKRAEGSLIQGPMEAARFGAGGLEVARDPGMFGASIRAVGDRPFGIEARSYYMPKSIADTIKEINTGVYHSEVSWLTRRYDLLQNMWKAPLMAPWPEFYKRNSITNASLIYLKSGLSLLHPSHQKDFLRVMTYVLNKEVISVGNLPKTAATFTGVAGAVGGGFVGGLQASQGDEGILDSVGTVISGALAGGLGGGVVGAASGLATRETLKSAGRAGAGALAPHAAVGAGMGASAAPEGDTLKGAAFGAVAGAGAARAALGKGWKNIDQLEKMTIKVGDNSFTIKEFAEEAAARGVFITHVSDELFKQTGLKTAAMAERMGMNPKAASAAVRPEQALFARDMFRAGELASEIPTRLMLFTIEAKRTGSLGEAARAVKDYLYDYSNLSLFERRVMRRIIPFYTWVKHAMATSVDSYIQNPGRVGNMFKFVNNQNKHVDVDPADYPDWLSERLKRIKVRRDIFTGEKKVEIKQGYGLVQEDMLDLWKQAFGGDPTKLLTRGPFVVTPAMELIADKDFFRGTHIKQRLYERSGYESGRAYENAPPWMKEAVGYRTDPATGYATVDPRAAWMLTEIPASRFMNIARKVYDSEGERYNWYALSRQVLGEKIYKYGPEQKLYVDKAKLDRMAMFLKRIGELKTYQKHYANKPKEPEIKY